MLLSLTVWCRAQRALTSICISLFWWEGVGGGRGGDVEESKGGGKEWDTKREVKTTYGWEVWTDRGERRAWQKQSTLKLTTDGTWQQMAKGKTQKGSAVEEILRWCHTTADCARTYSPGGEKRTRGTEPDRGMTEHGEVGEERPMQRERGRAESN